MLTLGLALFISASSVAANGAACAQPNTPAIVQVEPAMLPPILLAYDEHGSAKLIVTIDPLLALPTKVELAQPSGDAIIDAAAVQVARETAFTPETASCSAVGGRYFYDFEV
jgi:outer membrane biosynthesis protein TonB